MPFLWTAYVVLPVAGWGIWRGSPVGLAGAAALVAIWWTWSCRGPLPGRRWMPGLVLAKFVLGWFVLVPHGFEAKYYDNAAWLPPIERSTETRSRSFTRIDGRLVFGPPDAPDFPLYFLNDTSAGPRPFSVVWEGDMWARTSDAERGFYLRGQDVGAELWVDGLRVVELTRPAEEAIWRAPWREGRHRVLVRMQASSSESPRLEAGFFDLATGEKAPFEEGDTIPHPYPSWRIGSDRILRPLAAGIDVVLLVILAGCVMIACLRGVSRLAIGWLSAIAGGLAIAAAWAERVVLLAGGQLMYEQHARSLIFDGVMKVSPYPYFLALVHLIVGEDLAGVFLAQWLLAFFAVVAAWRTAARLFGELVGIAALALAGLLFVVGLASFARQLASENLFVPLFAALPLAMIMRAAERTPRTRMVLDVLLAAGVSLGGAWAWAVGLSPELRPDLREGVHFFSTGSSLGVMAIWLAALVGVALVIRGREPIGTGRWMALVPAALALGLLGVAVVLPHGYAERLVLPGCILVLPYSALGLMRTVDFLVPPDAGTPASASNVE